MKDKVVVITGASGGIGAAVAGILAKEGASVVLVARRKDALRTVADRCGAKALLIVADVTRRDETKRIVRESIDRFGHIDIWVNNVGQGITRVPSELTDDDIDEIVRINVKSAIYGMQEILPHFKERGEGQVVIATVMESRLQDVYTRAGACDRVADYYASVGVDP